MKHAILLLGVALIVSIGCARTEISDHLGEPTVMSLNQAIVVIPYPLTRYMERFYAWRSQTEVADCLRSSMKSANPNLQFIELDVFRNALYPWFAPSTTPQSLEELASVMKNPLVQERMNSIGVRFVILVTGYTDEGDMDGPMFGAAGPGAAGVLGYASSDRETNVSVIVWDEKEMLSLGDVEVKKTGSVKVIGLIFPIVIPTFTEGPACKEIGVRLVRLLTGGTFHNEKLIDPGDGLPSSEK
jgi:hypothetical protein